MQKLIYLLVATVLLMWAIWRIEVVYSYQAPDSKVELNPEGYINQYSKEFGSSKDELMKVGMCESGLKQTAYVKNDGGSESIGIFQYKRKTFERYSKLFGSELDINSYEDQIKLTSWIFARYPQEKRAWTCSKITGVIQ